MSDIKVGDKVIFINDVNWTYHGGAKMIYGEQYIVSDIIICSKCLELYYNLGAKMSNETDFAKCCGYMLVGKGIDWVHAKRVAPYYKNFKNFCSTMIFDNMHKDVETLVKEKKYEEAISIIKRLEKIRNEL